MRVTHEAEPPSPENRMSALERKEPIFPGAMLRDGVRARVYARAEVSPDGTVTGVRVRAFSTRSDLKADALLPFEVSVTRALKQWKFSPAAEGADRVRVACYTIDFNIFD